MIAIVDSGLTTTNLGDHIISSAVHEQLLQPLERSGRTVNTIPMHGHISPQSREVLREADEVIVCGTNLISDHMRFRRSWQWSRKDIELTNDKLTMFGVGWWQYQRTGVDPISARWMRKLAGQRPWAVRDEYTARRLQRAGVPAIHTSCPTLWNCRRQLLPTGRGRAIATLTDYNQDRKADEQLVRILNRTYNEVIYWPQGPGDRSYIESLHGAEASRVLDPTVTAFDEALRTPGTEYVGLRLHAGIRAIQLGVPTLILGIDNRAVEISRSVGLGVVSRHAVNRIERTLRSAAFIELALPEHAIAEWTSQLARV